MYTIARSERIMTCSRKFEKYRYIIAYENQPKYVAIYWKGLNYPILSDIVNKDTVDQHNWYLGNNYANTTVGNTQSSMHIMLMLGTEKYWDKPDNTNIDHINEFKLDNRLANLRVATQSQQNANRQTRSDKLPPIQELIDIGITELPKHVRWDKREQKFVIEKHPALVHANKKKQLSGSKSSKLSIVEKFQDILHKLQELDKQLPGSDTQFKEEKEKLRKEYVCITNLIRAVHDEELVQEQPVIECPVQAESKTIKGRKKVSALPNDCDVRIQDVPKYCYYRAANEKRGDFFVIERHPAMVEKRSWQTSSSRSLTTKYKFDDMMKVYATLQDSLKECQTNP